MKTAKENFQPSIEAMATPNKHWTTADEGGRR